MSIHFSLFLYLKILCFETQPVLFNTKIKEHCSMFTSHCECRYCSISTFDEAFSHEEEIAFGHTTFSNLVGLTSLWPSILTHGIEAVEYVYQAKKDSTMVTSVRWLEYFSIKGPNISEQLLLLKPFLDGPNTHRLPELYTHYITLYENALFTYGLHLSRTSTIRKCDCKDIATRQKAAVHETTEGDLFQGFSRRRLTTRENK